LNVDFLVAWKIELKPRVELLVIFLLYGSPPLRETLKELLSRIFFLLPFVLFASALFTLSCRIEEVTLWKLPSEHSPCFLTFPILPPESEHSVDIDVMSDAKIGSPLPKIPHYLQAFLRSVLNESKVSVYEA